MACSCVFGLKTRFGLYSYDPPNVVEGVSPQEAPSSKWKPGLSVAKDGKPELPARSLGLSCGFRSSPPQMPEREDYSYVLLWVACAPWSERCIFTNGAPHMCGTRSIIFVCNATFLTRAKSSASYTHSGCAKSEWRRLQDEYTAHFSYIFCCIKCNMFDVATTRPPHFLVR